MLKKISNLKGAKDLTKNAQKNINGGLNKFPIWPTSCGGDGSFIFQNGIKVCCYVPSQNWYIC